MALEEYQRKRNFSQTNEPEGSSAANSNSQKFVVQEHHASHLHFDFRFEVDGVLKSWAVPKGFPPAPGVRRLAIMTEDHPLEYLTFSGTIPEGNYGAGEMSIWDTGTYDWVARGVPTDGIAKGKLELVLHGDRLKGQYDMIRTDHEKNEWIIIKTKHDKEPTGQPSESIAEPDNNSLSAGSIEGSKTAPLPKFSDIDPMLAEALDKPFDDPDYQFEIKWDGYRALTFISNGKASMYSRNHLDLSSKFPELNKISDWLTVKDAVIDGEIVALDKSGTPQFQSLQNRLGFNFKQKPESQTRPKSSKVQDETTLVYMAFDLPFVDGHDLRSAMLKDRRALLKTIIKAGGPIRFSDHVEGKGKDLFREAESMGLEGVMAKRSDSPYVNRRSGDWKKIKSPKTLDAVIGGYTESKAAGRAFGSLILGLFDGKKLDFIGHVGTGYDETTMAGLIDAMGRTKSDISPFTTVPEVNGKPHWIKPEMVCEVKYANVTGDARLRQPVFVRLRPDKPAGECKMDDLHLVLKPSEQSQGKGDPPDDVDKQEIDEPLLSDSRIDGSELHVDGHSVKVTHLNKVFWPKTSTTKRDLLRYYESISKTLLPHIANRPLVVQRYPNGVEGKSFFQHDILAGRAEPPSFLQTYDIVESNGPVHYALCDEVSDLLYLVNLGAIPIHCWNVTTKKPEYPDRIVWDFDPGADFSSAVDAALVVKSVLDDAKLRSAVKTSGASGLHVYLPIKPNYDSDFVVAFATLVGRIAESLRPDLITLERRVNKRGANQVYLDCLQNGVGKTVVAPYSVRAEPAPTVSTPLDWNEVDDSLDPTSFTIDHVLERIDKRGDLFATVLTDLQELAKPIEELSKKETAK